MKFVISAFLMSILIILINGKKDDVESKQKVNILYIIDSQNTNQPRNCNGGARSFTRRN
jgi:hypothetical protein